MIDPDCIDVLLAIERVVVSAITCLCFVNILHFFLFFSEVQLRSQTRVHPLHFAYLSVTWRITLLFNDSIWH